uniref:Protein FAM32A n=1 Tax=Aceria tosichella TaxID=561515 RepID=A0A6G1SP25_9ACAR
MDLDDYDLVTKKPLKALVAEQKTKNKKKKRLIQDDPLAGVSNESKTIVITATKAEQAFKSKQEKIAEKRILKKAQKTHKQRVEEFNKHLDSLSEHYDIPKVSWTK